MIDRRETISRRDRISMFTRGAVYARKSLTQVVMEQKFAFVFAPLNHLECEFLHEQQSRDWKFVIISTIAVCVGR